MNRTESLFLKKLGACEDARAWYKSVKTLREAWDTCPRPDWMLWALNQIGFEDDKKCRLFACACVRGTPLADGRTLWDLLTDDRSRHAVEVAERYAQGAAAEEERDAARAAAWAAAGDAAWAAAGDAARAAAWAAAGDAARAAAWAAAGDAARDAAWAAAGDAARAWQADLLRQWISWDEVQAVLDLYKAQKEKAK